MVSTTTLVAVVNFVIKVGSRIFFKKENPHCCRKGLINDEGMVLIEHTVYEGEEFESDELEHSANVIMKPDVVKPESKVVKAKK